MIEGGWWLTDAPPWLTELLPCGDGRFCVVYPPLPAIAALPFIPFVSTALAQVLASRVAGGASAGGLYYALRAYRAPRAYAPGGGGLSGFRTTRFFTSGDRRALCAAHPMSMLLLPASF